MNLGHVAAAMVAFQLLFSAAAAPQERGVGDDPLPPATPQLPCDSQSLPETAAQGRVPKSDVDSGRAAHGYTCNTYRVGSYGATGGYQVQRYTDAHGHDCAYYDTSTLFPKDAATNATQGGSGVYVMDMSNPTKPTLTATLTTPAMLSPHESLRVNAKRGLLAADMGYPTFNPGFVDVYDISQDCRNPALDSSTPLGVLGHESAFSPDGTIFYVSSTGGGTLTAVDLTNPKVPSVIWVSFSYKPHGMSVSDDGNRLYIADTGLPGLIILDVSQVNRHIVNPTVPVRSKLSWMVVSIPQIAVPFTEHGHPYLLESDEFTNTTLSKGAGGYDPSAVVGAARIIDIQDDQNPVVVSNLRLAVDSTAARSGPQQNDYGAQDDFTGYAAHYCNVPTRDNPTYVACTFIMSGLRIFSVKDVVHPVEIGYFNAPSHNGQFSPSGGNAAFSSPAFVPARNEIWYTDSNWGFYVIRMTGAAFSNARPLPART